MRIAYLAAGAAGMYCGSCLHDNTLAAALLNLEEDLVLVPIYTPLRTDESDVSEPRVFMGGINAYLQQKSALFRHTPRWMDSWLDQPWLLRLATRRAASVDPTRLGDLTLSMIRGELGHQHKELEKLVDWLADDVQPDIVHLSNFLMLGLARRISQRCGAAVVCSLSGEDIFLDKLHPAYQQEAQRLLRERAAEVDAFTALNTYYADLMHHFLAVPRERVHVLPHGLNLEGYQESPQQIPATPPRIGFLARICEDKGLHLLVEACELLAERDGIPEFEVHAAGYLGSGDRKYLRAIQARAARGPLAKRFFYLGEPDRATKIAYLRSLSIMCTPTIYRESKGLPVLEAWAAGRPVVAPRHGAFPEMLAATGGGLLHQPADAADLAQRLAELLCDPERAEQLGEAGRRVVHERLHARAMAEKTRDLYRRLAGRARS